MLLKMRGVIGLSTAAITHHYGDGSLARAAQSISDAHGKGDSSPPPKKDLNFDSRLAC